MEDKKSQVLFDGFIEHLRLEVNSVLRLRVLSVSEIILSEGIQVTTFLDYFYCILFFIVGQVSIPFSTETDFFAIKDTKTFLIAKSSYYFLFFVPLTVNLLS